MKHYTDYSLKEHNTLKIDSKCKNFYVIESQDDIQQLPKDIISDDTVVLGDGANILFKGDYDGTVIQLNIAEVRIISETDDTVNIHVDAGMNWHELVAYTVDHGWGGIENMALIPGRVGAAPIGNIAAYGQNFSDVCVSVDVYSYADGKIETFSKDECGFSYRESAFKHSLKGKYMIVGVTMKLHKHPEINTEYWSKKHGSVGEVLRRNGDGPYAIKDVYNAIIQLRTEKFPDMKQFGTAGSFFKNPLVSKDKLLELDAKIPGLQHYPVSGLHYVPNDIENVDDYVKIAAGEVLDKGMSLAGYWDGNVGLHEKHALVLVTNGNATGAEVDSFASHIEKRFFDYCGVELEREVQTI